MESLRSFINQPKGLWSLEQIRAGFEKFVEAYGRYPTAHEIDAYEYLPSSRSLQRSYGGLVEVRKKLFPEAIQDFTTGDYRRNMASATYRRSQDYEEVFYEKLCLEFESIAVHEHKVIRPGRVTCDFYIYHNDEEGVCLDLFYAKDLFSVTGVVNNKVKRYRSLQCPVIFILMHDGAIANSSVEQLILSKKTKVPDHISVMTEEYFWGGYIPALKGQSKYAR